MTRHTVYVALTFEIDDDALLSPGRAGAPDVELVQRLVDAVATDDLARSGVRLVAPRRLEQASDPEAGRSTPRTRTASSESIS